MLVCAGHQHGINAKLRKQRAEAINAIHRALELSRCLEALEHVVSIEILSPATWRGAECGAVVAVPVIQAKALPLAQCDLLTTVGRAGNVVRPRAQRCRKSRI